MRGKRKNVNIKVTKTATARRRSHTQGPAIDSATRMNRRADTAISSRSKKEIYARYTRTFKFHNLNREVLLPDPEDFQITEN